MKRYIKYLERKAIRDVLKFLIALLIGYCALHLASCNKNPDTETNGDYCEVQVDGSYDCE